MKAAILVLDKCTGHWMTPEGSYSIKVGFADGEFTPVKWFLAPMGTHQHIGG